MSLQDANPINEYPIEYQVRNEPLVNYKRVSRKIMEKAEKIYSIVTKNSKSKMAKFYKDLSCDFKLLEEKSAEYKV